MVIAISLLLAQTPAAYASVSGKGPATLKFVQNARNLAAIEVKINGKGPFLMGIDTCAAGGGRLSTKLCADLGLTPAGEAMAGDGTGQNMRRIQLRQAAKLEFGGFVFSKAVFRESSSVMPAGPVAPGSSGPQVDGILGFGFFKELLLKIDFKNKLVSVSRGKLAKGASTIAMDDSDGISTINVQIGNQRCAVHFDTGADGGLVLPETMAKEFKFKEPLRVLGRLKTNFNDVEIKGAPLDGQVKLGSVMLESPMLAFATIFRNVNFGRRLMQGYAFTFDQKSDLMRIE